MRKRRIIKNKSSKKIKNQFVIMVGDEGAILCHFLDNKLSSRVFVDNPASEDVNLFHKLLSSYPTHPVTMLVDVLEQSYTQQMIPPVSSMGLVSQVQRRMKRELRPEDLNNFLVGGRSKDGRKDWSVLFISLANTDPFAKWLAFLMQQKNKFNGVFLLPVESTKMVRDLKKQLSDGSVVAEWEILLLHNKTGGFRIVAFRDGKIVFARLAQNLIGDNIPEVVVGNLEQEIQNTFEYLKRLGFRNDVASRMTIVAAAEILEKVDTKVLKFGEINLLAPIQASDFLGLPDAVGTKDKYADILCAAHFASQKTHQLKFFTSYTKKLDQMYMAVKALTIMIGISIVGGIGYEVSKALESMDAYKETEKVSRQLKNQTATISRGEDTLKKSSGKNTEKMVAIYNAYTNLPTNKYLLLSTLSKISPEFGDDKVITQITFTNGNAKDAAGKKEATDIVDLSTYKTANEKYEITIGFDYILTESQTGKIKNISDDFLAKLKKLLPNSEITYTKEAVVKVEGEFESVVEQIDTGSNAVNKFPAEIKIVTDTTKQMPQAGMPVQGATPPAGPGNDPLMMMGAPNRGVPQ